jgi:UDP-N-acetylmuramate dehydrogenase
MMISYDSVLRPLFGERLRLDEPLARYTVARLGGPADALIVAESASDLKSVMLAAWEYDWPVRIIGGGANILISDAGFRGLIVINDAKALNITDSGLVTAESGVGLIPLCRETMNRGLAGFEWAIGVPGTIGGAVVNNAGAHGGDIAHNLVWADILTSGGAEERWPVERLEYAYRESALKRMSKRGDSFAVLRAALQFEPGHDPAELHHRADEFNAHRKHTQPPGASLGSMFKNPPGDYAGRLIEAAGLKGARVGGVVISPVHANFMVNIGGGTAGDYLALIDLARRMVYDKFGVELELEIELVGF